MGARELFEEVLDLVFPRRCVQCRTVGAWLCAACAMQLTPLPAERCPRCGAPTWASVSPRVRAGRLGRGDHEERGAQDAYDGRLVCAECGGRELAFAFAAAAFVYEGPARALVTACKFRSMRSLAREMAVLAGPAFVAACGGEDAGSVPAPAGRAADRDTRAADADGPVRGAAVADPGLAVTWVPAHRTRTVERGFDQAELLARELAGLAALPAVPLLRRTRATARQSGLHGAERAANVSDAFQLRPGADRVLTGFKRVVIVDDVYTTGETLNHCASVLTEAGVDPRAFTFARAVRRSSPRATRSSTPASSAHREAAFHAKERSR
ncbi:MAG: ComF family protein [Thermoleophilia bacterium]|nr:ComF family protein [Thermoleophilia bacterium]